MATRLWSDWRLTLAAILAVAFVLRLAAAAAVELRLADRPGQRFLIEGDATGYWDLAEDLAHGREYAVHQPPRRIHRMPGMPALLAVPIGLFGDRLIPARIFLSLVGTACCAAVFWLGNVLVNRTIGLIACAVAAVAPTYVGFSPLVLSETPFAGAMTLSVAAAALAAHHAGLWRKPAVNGRLPDPSFMKAVFWAVATGVFIGLACYLRPSWLLAAPLASVLLLIGGHFAARRPTNGPAISRARQFLRVALLALLVPACTLLSLAPWAIRNHRVSGHFVLTTLWMGPSLYDSFNPEADGDSDMTFFDEDALPAKGLTEYEVDRHYRDLAWEYIRTHPARAAELAWLKLVRFWKPWPNAEQFDRWWMQLAVAGTFLPIVALTLYGLGSARIDATAVLLSAGPILYFTLLHMVFVGSLRYRLPAEYPLLVLAAAGVERWWIRRNAV